MAEMLDPRAWERANGEFLAASLAWVRLLLRRHAPRPEPSFPPPTAPSRAAPPSATAIEAPSGRWFGRRDRAAAPVPAERREPPLHVLVTDDDVAAAAAAAETAADILPPPALVGLAARFGLSRFERDVLLLCAAVELDPTVGALCAATQGSEGMVYPTFALAFGVLPAPEWAAVSPERGLRHWRLIEVHQPAGRPLTTSALGADERVVNHLKGLDYLDDRLAPLVGELSPVPGAVLPPSQEQVVDAAGQAWSAFGESPVVTLLGPASASKQLIAGRVAASFGLTVHRLAAPLLPTGAAELDNLARLWQRETMLAPTALYLDADDADADGPGAPPSRRSSAGWRRPRSSPPGRAGPTSAARPCCWTWPRPPRPNGPTPGGRRWAPARTQRSSTGWPASSPSTRPASPCSPPPPRPTSCGRPASPGAAPASTGWHGGCTRPRAGPTSCCPTTSWACCTGLPTRCASAPACTTSGGSPTA